MVAVFTAACSEEATRPHIAGEISLPPQKAASDAAAVRKIQHILVGFEGSIPGKKIERSLDEAQALATEIFNKAKSNPQDFENLVRAHSDDQVPGIYELVDFGVKPEGVQFTRASMVKGFGDLAFQLRPGEVGFLKFDKEKSPYGFHILYRLP